MNILITGINGFLGKNLAVRLNENDDYKISGITRDTSIIETKKKVSDADLIFHLAGENRSNNNQDFVNNNHLLTKLICQCLSEEKKNIPVIYSSSVQARNSGIYGETKKLAEDELIKLQKDNHNNVFIIRLPGIFGKWSKPNYNSVVSTFCFQAANGEKLEVHERAEPLLLAHVDDVVDEFILILESLINKKHIPSGILPFKKTHSITVQELAEKIKCFSKKRESSFLEKISDGFDKALYSTYVTYLPKKKYLYPIEKNTDDRGVFTEFLKSDHFGQISFFTINPDCVRGMHYHHVKVEKFLVIQGIGEFVYEDILTNEKDTFIISADDSNVLETIPGVSHSIKNIGEEKLIVLAYANEVFDKLNPDTYYFEIDNEKA